MKVLVTGAKGMLGQDLCPILEDEEYDVVEADISDFDITDKDMTRNFINEVKPDVIIHCAAYTNVDGAETNKELAMKINGEGTKNIAEVCNQNDITLVYISTDYVFDGKKQGKYLPNDVTNPINVYGLSKLAGEKAVLECNKHYITRTSWLYGHHGKNFVETMISLAEKPELKVVNDQIGCPTWTVELANGIVQLLREEKPYGIYHICGSGSTSWYDFAKEIFELTDLKVNLKPCLTEEFPRDAKRPQNSIMENDNLCRNWKTALKEYIELRV